MQGPSVQQYQFISAQIRGWLAVSEWMVRCLGFKFSSPRDMWGQSQLFRLGVFECIHLVLPAMIIVKKMKNNLMFVYAGVFHPL